MGKSFLKEMIFTYFKVAIKCNIFIQKLIGNNLRAATSKLCDTHQSCCFVMDNAHCIVKRKHSPVGNKPEWMESQGNRLASRYSHKWTVE